MKTIIPDIIIGLCLFILFTSIIINFAEAKGKKKKERRSVVETGTMTLFFLVFYALIRFDIGGIEVPQAVKMIDTGIGLAIIIFGTYVNVRGRLSLGKNWANQATLYDSQTLVREGPYRFVRHPLYASLIWMFYGAILVYPNYLAFLLVTLVFVPFMAYRAKLEEEMLEKEFKGYKEYKKEVGMFFPKLP